MKSNNWGGEIISVVWALIILASSRAIVRGTWANGETLVKTSEKKKKQFHG